MQLVPAAQASTARFWEIDAARGITVILMVFFHLMWDLGYLGLSSVSVFTPGWQVFARSIGSSFTFLLGVSVAMRSMQRGQRSAQSLRPLFRRGALIFGYGMLVTLATYLVVGEQFVVFGILHMQGIALILAALCVGRPVWITATLGLLALGVGFFVNTLSAPFPWLIWLGVAEQGRVMVDYYPLLPWSGFALLGVAVGTIVYRHGASPIPTTTMHESVPIRALCWLGRHSLPIYLIHQPLLLGTLMLVLQFTE